MREIIAPQMQAEIGSLRRPSLKGYGARHETADSSGDRAKHSQRLQRTMKSRAGVSEGRQVPPIVYVAPLKREPIQFGLDFSVDTTLTKQASILPRHFDVYRISLRGVPVDLGHEPTGSLGLSFNPRNFGTLTALASISAMNIHIQRQGKGFIELALGQLGLGYDSDKNTFVPLTAQAEIHSPNEHFSIYLNGGGTWTHAPGQGWIATWNPLTLGIVFHVLNP